MLRTSFYYEVLIVLLSTEVVLSVAFPVYSPCLKRSISTKRLPDNTDRENCPLISYWPGPGVSNLLSRVEETSSSMVLRVFSFMISLGNFMNCLSWTLLLRSISFCSREVDAVVMFAPRCVTFDLNILYFLLSCEFGCCYY